MNEHPLAEEYLRWLEPQLRDDQGESDKTYGDLMRLMFEKEFVWIVANDDNRIQDGLELRAEFCYANHIRSDALADLGPCSFLEVLIGLSRRLAFLAGSRAPGWSWQLLNNLELHRMADPLERRKVRKVEAIMDDVIWRRYRPDGGGGFFPLIDSDDDQTRIEMWYQMAAYVGELHPEY